jgi:hypothetical protein
MAKFALILGDFLLIVLGFLTLIYRIMKWRSGKPKLWPISIKNNIYSNVPFALLIAGIVLISLAYLSSQKRQLMPNWTF